MSDSLYSVRKPLSLLGSCTSLLVSRGAFLSTEVAMERRSTRDLTLAGARLAKERLRNPEWTHDLVRECNALAEEWLGTGRGKRRDGLRGRAPRMEVSCSHIPFDLLSPVESYG